MGVIAWSATLINISQPRDMMLSLITTGMYTHIEYLLKILTLIFSILNHPKMFSFTNVMLLSAQVLIITVVISGLVL